METPKRFQFICEFILKKIRFEFPFEKPRRWLKAFLFGEDVFLERSFMSIDTLI